MANGGVSLSGDLLFLRSYFVLRKKVMFDVEIGWGDKAMSAFLSGHGLASCKTSVLQETNQCCQD